MLGSLSAPDIFFYEKSIMSPYRLPSKGKPSQLSSKGKPSQLFDSWYVFLWRIYIVASQTLKVLENRINRSAPDIFFYEECLYCCLTDHQARGNQISVPDEYASVQQLIYSILIPSTVPLFEHLRLFLHFSTRRLGWFTIYLAIVLNVKISQLRGLRYGTFTIVFGRLWADRGRYSQKISQEANRLIQNLR